MTTAPDTGRARMLLELDRPAEARQMLTRVVAADPSDGAALCLLAQACLAVGDAHSALGAAQAAARVDPHEEWALRLAALAMARQGHTGYARDYADAAVRTEPQSWRTHLVRAQVDLAGDAVTDMTLAAARHAVMLAPHEAECHRAVGNALLARKQRAAAEVALREAARLRPEDAAIRNDLARLHAARRNLGLAAAGFAEAAALDPTDRVAAANLSVVGAKALRVIHIILWIALITAGQVAGDGTHPSRLAAAIGWAISGVALVVFGLLLWRGARPRMLALVRLVVRRDRLLAVWFGWLAAAFLLLGAAALVPPRHVSTLITASFVCVALGLLTAILRRRNR